MLKPVKIIQLSHFNPKKDSYHPDRGSDQFFVASWAGLIGRRLKKRFPEMDVEVWRAEPYFKKKMEKEVFDLKGIIFPYQKPIIPKVLTLEMVKRILHYQKTYQVIIHYHSINAKFLILAPYLFEKSLIIASDHGSNLPLVTNLKKRIQDRLLKSSLKKIAAITYIQNRTKKFLESFSKHPPLFFLPVGADFKQFYPLDKQQCRRELGLEQNKIFGIYVGRFYRLKSVDLILEAYHMLKEKYNFSIIFVGGSREKSDDLFDEVVKSGCPYYGYQPWEKMKKFYNAADFYIHPVFNPQFGGLDVSWMEAAACNIPVLSPQLDELDFDYMYLGLSIKSKEEIESKVELMINSYQEFLHCREVAQQHLDGNTSIMDKLSLIYGNLIQKD